MDTANGRPVQGAGELKQNAERANWSLAHTWHVGMGLQHAGVDLGDAMTYSVLMVLGRVWLAHIQRIGEEWQKKQLTAA